MDTFTPLTRELYKSANIELSGYNIPRHEFIDLRQELVCQCYSYHQRMVTSGKPPDLSTLRKYLQMRKKELWCRSFVGKNGGGTSKRDIMNQKHQWDGRFEKSEFNDELPNRRLNNRTVVEEFFTSRIDCKIFMEKLNKLQQKILDLLMQGFKLGEISKLVKKQYTKIKQIIESLKEAFVKYFDVKLQYE